MREILLNISLTAIALCLFKMLLPEGAMQKQTNFLIACFFLSSMLFFFSSGRADLAHGLSQLSTADEIPYIDFDHEFEQAQIRAIEREIRREARYVFAEVLARENIFPQEILTSVNISDTYSISISEVRLVFTAQNEEPTDEELELLRDAVYIIQKEVGETVLVTGAFQISRGNENE